MEAFRHDAARTKHSISQAGQTLQCEADAGQVMAAGESRLDQNLSFPSGADADLLGQMLGFKQASDSESAFDEPIEYYGVAKQATAAEAAHEGDKENNYFQFGALADAGSQKWQIDTELHMLDES